jgi:hypothetical protein
MNTYRAHTIAELKHALTLARLCNRISESYNKIDRITAKEILGLLDTFNWTCFKTGIVHSTETPLTIEFIFSLSGVGRVKVSNMRPVYIPRQLPGAYVLPRYGRYMRPPTNATRYPVCRLPPIPCIAPLVSACRFGASMKYCCVWRIIDT